MTLIQVIHILQQIALQQPNIRTATDGSIYEFLNANPSVEYDVFHVSQTTHRIEEDVDYYGFNLFYVSRLDATMENNRLTIQSVAKEALTNIVRSFCEEYAAIDELPILRFYPFTQRFNDECAGMYVQLEIGIPVDWVCEDDFGEVTAAYPEGSVRLQSKTITVRTNGTRSIEPDSGYDGFSDITIITDVNAEPELQQITATTNSIYTPSEGYDGFSKVVVDVPQGSSATLGELTVTGTAPFSQTFYSSSDEFDGYSAVTVNIAASGCPDCPDCPECPECPECPDCTPYYNSGYTDGEADQKAKLGTLLIRNNGTYRNNDGWSSLTVDVSAASSNDDPYTLEYRTTDGSLIDEGYSQVRLNAWDKNHNLLTRVSNVYSGDTGKITWNGKVSLLETYEPNRNDWSIYDDFSKLIWVRIPSETAELGGFCFYRSSLTGVTLNNNLSFIGTHTFAECTGLTEAVLDASTSLINLDSFSGCTSLSSLTIYTGPWSTCQLGSRAFKNCNNLRTIYSHTHYPFDISKLSVILDQAQENPFRGLPARGTLYVPAGTRSKYESLWLPYLNNWTIRAIL